VILDATALAGGVYTTTLVIENNDAIGGAIYVPVTMTVTPAPILNIAKTASPDSVQASSLLTYTIVVGNVGGLNATDVTITDTIPVHTTFVSADSGGSLTDNQVHWTGRTVNASGTDIINANYDTTCAEGVSATGIPVVTRCISPIAGRITYLPRILRSYAIPSSPLQTAGGLLTRGGTILL